MITPHPVVIHFVWPVVFWNYWPSSLESW